MLLCVEQLTEQENNGFFIFLIVLQNPRFDRDVLLAAPDFADDDAERESARRRPGESDMDYFERRYQERVSSNVCVR